MTETIRFGTDGWRALIAEDFTFANLRRIADAAGRVFAEDNPGGTILVGYDTRFEAAAFAAEASAVIAAHGLTVRCSDKMLPTPALSWATDRSDAVGAVMLTASHNPSEYLGFKLKMGDGGSAPPSFTKRVEAALPAEDPGRSAAAFATVDLLSDYLNSLVELVDADVIAGANLHLVVDPLYGAGQGYLAAVLARLGAEVVEIHADPNPGFGGLHPEPIPPWIDEMQRAVLDANFDAGFTTDGDADRIGACDRHGEFVNPQRIFALTLAPPRRGPRHDRQGRQDAVHLGARRPHRRAPRPRGHHHPDRLQVHLRADDRAPEEPRPRRRAFSSAGRRAAASACRSG